MWASVGGGSSCPAGSSFITALNFCVDTVMLTVPVNYLNAGQYCASRGMLIPTRGQMDAMHAASASIPGWSYNQYYVVPWSSNSHFACNPPNTSTYCADNVWSASGYALCVK